jgi:hypothetical protein
MAKKNEINHIEIMINKQFEIAGYDLNDVNYQMLIDTKDQDWYTRYTTTKEKDAEYSEWCKKYINKHITKTRVEKEFMWFHLMYSLKIAE